ncbi:MAG TPA: metalloregulator ArsR/SmtB family transcription factor [Marmoricola sp.]|nr:metalloregulator ArsR/SmtB family transcription factor [Marmoricola sp.]
MDAFVAVADPVRRSLLLELSEAPSRVVDLTANRGISRPAVSKHLRLLLAAGMVVAEDRGRERWYSLRTEGLEDLDAFMSQLRAPRPRFGPADLDGLELEVRRTGRERRTAAPSPHRSDPSDRVAKTEETA